MKYKYAILFTAACLLNQASAAFVSFDTGGARGHEFLVPGGARVQASAVNPTSRVRFGYLTTPGVSTSFVEFSTTTINNPLAAATIGGFVNADTTQNGSAAAVAALKAAPQVAIWVYGQGGAQGLFTSTSWAAPAALTEAVDSSYLVLLGVASGAATLPPVVTAIPIPGFTLATYLTPATITVTTGTNQNGSRYTLGIPEPTTTLLLAMLGGMGLVRRKR